MAIQPNPIQLVAQGMRGYGTLPMVLEKMNLQEFANRLLPEHLAFSLGQNLNENDLMQLISSFSDARRQQDIGALSRPLNFITTGIFNHPRGPEIWNRLDIDQRQQVVNYVIQYIQPLIKAYNIRLHPALLTAAGIAIAAAPRDVGIIRRLMDTFDLVRHIPAIQNIETKLRGLGHSKKMIGIIIGGILFIKNGLGLEYLGLDKILPEEVLTLMETIAHGKFSEGLEDLMAIKESTFESTGLNLGELNPESISKLKLDKLLPKDISAMQRTGQESFFSRLKGTFSKDELEEAMIEASKMKVLADIKREEERLWAEPSKYSEYTRTSQLSPSTSVPSIGVPSSSTGVPYYLKPAEIKDRPIDRFYRRLDSLTTQEKEQSQFYKHFEGVEGVNFRIKREEFIDKIKLLGLTDRQMEEAIENFIMDNLRGFATTLISQPHSPIDAELAKTVLGEMKRPLTSVSGGGNSYYGLYDDTIGKYQALRQQMMAKPIPEFDQTYLRLQGLQVPYPVMEPLDMHVNPRVRKPREHGLQKMANVYEPLDNIGKKIAKVV